MIDSTVTLNKLLYSPGVIEDVVVESDDILVLVGRSVSKVLAIHDADKRIVHPSHSAIGSWEHTVHILVVEADGEVLIIGGNIHDGSVADGHTFNTAIPKLSSTG